MRAKLCFAAGGVGNGVAGTIAFPNREFGNEGKDYKRAQLSIAASATAYIAVALACVTLVTAAPIHCGACLGVSGRFILPSIRI